MPLAVGPSEFSLVLVILLVVALPIAAFAFSKSGKALEDLGKGNFSIDRKAAPDNDSIAPQAAAAERDEEIRQMVEASAFRRRERGEPELDVQAEIDRLLGQQRPEISPEDAEELNEAMGGGAMREEVRQVVVANNERRQRRGEAPLDVEHEVDRRLREWS